jgi:hypothetical protein
MAKRPKLSEFRTCTISIYPPSIWPSTFTRDFKLNHPTPLGKQKYFDPQLIKLLKKFLYVDDFVSGADDEKEAEHLK